MANEITALERRANLSVLFYYPIPGVLKVTGAVPTPSAKLPWASVFVQAEKDALDAGDAMFHVVQIGMPEGQNAAATLAVLRAKYADLEQRFKDQYQRRYEFAGQRFDK